MDIDADQLEARLMSHGVYVTSLDVEVDSLAITYESVTAGQTGAVPHREVGRVINVVRDLAESPVAIRGTVTDLDDDLVGDWHAEADWLRALEAGDLSEVEFSQRVLETIDHA
ncbi:hypothetical protein [Halomicrococcus gelatinilyticus]|uniref:hypothetical protein n=1 Tax=Halomicrococcus gelatinilyticus TaxID=1702103 RepID=UPI002E0E6909